MSAWVDYRRHSGWRPVPAPRMTADPRVLDLTWAERGVFSALWLVTDDHGRFTAHPRELAGRIGWVDSPAKLIRVLRRIEATGYLRLYEVEGQAFGELADFLELSKLNNRQPAAYPAPVEARLEAPPEARPEPHPKAAPEPLGQKEERKKKTEEKKPSSSSPEPQYARDAREAQASLGSGLAAEVAWPSPSVAMAARQWRGHLAAYQHGQSSIPHVTDVQLLGLVHEWGAEAFEAAVVRHVGENASDGRWTRPFESLSIRCKWASTQIAAGRVVPAVAAEGHRAAERPSRPEPMAVETPSLVVGAEPAWWPHVLDEIRECVPSPSDWMTWLQPIGAAEHDGGLVIVCPDSAHATMVEERYRGLIEAGVVGHVAGPVVFAAMDGLIRAVA